MRRYLHISLLMNGCPFFEAAAQKKLRKFWTTSLRKKSSCLFLFRKEKKARKWMSNIIYFYFAVQRYVDLDSHETLILLAIINIKSWEVEAKEEKAPSFPDSASSSAGGKAKESAPSLPFFF
uniref:Hyp7 n=1 Tax=Moniliophthora roreri (strain MCA 2997) TaxID=1381753 RepID=F2WVJ6_MONRO|nr:hyp7 [Moniliophthora roreri]ADO51590.1 hyp7 [Moniliophthora roreri]